MEVLPWAFFRHQNNSPFTLFQSLFWWKYCPGPGLSCDIGNLLFLFQSLFWWKYCPGCCFGWINLSEFQSFNPCSGGSIALGQFPRERWGRFPQFQSLFWWKYCPGHRYLPAHYEIATGFQSLFWWKYCPGPVLASHLHRQQCFNPCSGGSIALGPGPGERLACDKKFQSLFWWKYCPGRDLAFISDLDKLFQSLFWWKYCPGLIPATVITRPDSMFQSLFWWKYCPGRTEPAVITCLMFTCFNPCSGGSIALGPDVATRPGR